MISFCKNYTLKHIASVIGARLHNVKDECLSIVGLCTLSAADKNTIAYFGADLGVDAAYLDDLKNTNAAAVLVSEKHLDKVRGAALVVKNVRLSLGQLLLKLSEPEYKAKAPGFRAENVSIGLDCNIDKTASFAENVVIGDNVVIGENVKIFANVVIGDNVSIGANTIIYPNVTIYSRSQIGAFCKINSNTSIGSDGFGYANENGEWHYLPHLAKIVIGDRVEVGSNTSIDRGFLTDTVIGDGTIIDNQVQIAHNVAIGKNVAIAGSSAIAGSVEIGDYCMFGGHSKVSGHVKIAPRTIVMADTAITKNISEPDGTYASYVHAKPRVEWQKSLSRIYKLDDMAKQVIRLQKKVSMFEKYVNNREKEEIDNE